MLYSRNNTDEPTVVCKLPMRWANRRHSREDIKHSRTNVVYVSNFDEKFSVSSIFIFFSLLVGYVIFITLLNKLFTKLFATYHAIKHYI